MFVIDEEYPTIIDGDANGFPVVKLEGTTKNANRCTLKNLTLKNGKINSGEFGSILDIKVCNVPKIVNCQLKNGYGGSASVYVYYSDSVEFNNVQVVENDRFFRSFASTISLNKCRICNNSDPEYISGFMVQRGSALINNSIFYNNQSGSEHADWRKYCVICAYEDARLNITNSTIMHNKGGNSINRGIHIAYNSKLFLRNTIIWGHDSSSVSLSFNNDSVDIDFCILQNENNSIKNFASGSVILGENIIYDNPLITDTLYGFDPSLESPALGSASPIYSSNDDYWGNPRPMPIGTNPDIGAFEVQESPANKIFNLLYSESDKINIFPNSFDNNLTIKIEPNLIGEKISIFDQLGKHILSRKLNNAVNNLDLAHITKGIYFIQIGDWNYKIVKN